MDLDLDLAISTAKREHDDFGSINKIKKKCPAEFKVYIKRLQRRLDNVTETIDHIPETGEYVVPRLSRLKAERRLLKGLITELSEVEVLYESTGSALSELVDKKKKISIKTSKSTVIIPKV